MICCRVACASRAMALCIPTSEYTQESGSPILSFFMRGGEQDDDEALFLGYQSLRGAGADANLCQGSHRYRHRTDDVPPDTEGLRGASAQPDPVAGGGRRRNTG